MPPNRISGPFKFQVALAGLALAAATFAGCGQASNERVKIITPSEFRALQKARAGISRMMNDLDRATDAALPLADRLAKVAAVVRQHERDMPKPQMTETNELPEDFDERFRGTITGDLLEMNKSMSWKENDGTGQDSISAWYVANFYLAAIHNMYGLKDFEDYLARHTLDDGTRINQADPPNMPAGSMRTFGNSVTGAGVGVNISSDEKGDISYVMSSSSRLWSGRQEASVSDIEARFIGNAREAVGEGDALLIERTDIGQGAKQPVG